jgi:hypothetical protein
MRLKEINYVYYKNYTKPVNTSVGQNVELNECQSTLYIQLVLCFKGLWVLLSLLRIRNYYFLCKYTKYVHVELNVRY